MKSNLIHEHKNLVKQGEYLAARILLRLLREGRISLGLSDDDWLVEKIADKYSLNRQYTRCWNTIVSLRD